MILAGAFELPYGLTNHMESKRLDRSVHGRFDFVFDFIGLYRLVA